MFFIFLKKKGLSFRIILSCKGNWVFFSLCLSLSLSYSFLQNMQYSNK